MHEYPEAIGATKNSALHLVLEHNPSLGLVTEMIELFTKVNSTSFSKTSSGSRKKKKKR